MRIAVQGFAFLFLVAGYELAHGEPAVARPLRPNIILILADDQGYGDLSCLGNQILKTPHLDRLHDQSIRLTDFHVAPMCSPTRGELLTGRDALSNGATFVCMGRSNIRSGIPTLADIFASGGYKTAIFGKWHLGDNYPYRPQDRGFQESLCHRAWGITSIADHFGNDYFNDQFLHNGQPREFHKYCTDVWFDEAMKWIRDRQSAHEPFLVYLPTNAPHWPHWVAENYRRPYAGRVTDEVAGFYGMIANLDENVGRLVSTLDETGLAKNTILVYMTDNGTSDGEQVFNAGMRGNKTSLYEGGHRVPCFIRWPGGNLGPPRDIDETTQCQDILPTLSDLAEIELPNDLMLDGQSLARLLRGGPLPDRMLVVQYGGQLRKEEAAVLWNKWRLVKGSELYDLGADPGQKANIAARHPDVVDKMRRHYDVWWARLMPAADEYCPITIGSERENPTRLTACDWAGVYCDNYFCYRLGENLNGAWHMNVEQPGTYAVSLRRWPEESGLAIAAAAPPLRGKYGSLPAGKALPIAAARLKFGLFEAEQPVGAQDQQVTFTVQLVAGPTLLSTGFFDTAGKSLCGAYYVNINRLNVRAPAKEMPGKVDSQLHLKNHL
ncbi:MAG: arylsulfatase [Planctomycetia bacterium]|nr:arylsulfatase [Planctomycetia bacterium]